MGRSLLVTLSSSKALSFLSPALSSRPPLLPSLSQLTPPLLSFLVSWPLIPPSSLCLLHPPLYQALPMIGCGYRCWGSCNSGERTRGAFFRRELE